MEVEEEVEREVAGVEVGEELQEEAGARWASSSLRNPALSGL